MSPLVSIVFTSYNHKEFLKQALDSLTKQTYPNIELIIVDDCSSDGSQELIKQYADLTFVQLHLREVNSGSYVKASNYGAQFAKGTYIIFAQCDDFAEPTQVEKLINAIKLNPTVGVAFSRSAMINEKGEFLCTDFEGRESRFKRQLQSDAIITGKMMREYLSYSCVIPNLSAAILSKQLYEKAGRLSEQFLVAADWKLWLELSEITDFYYITESLNNFRQHSTTIRSKTKIKIQVLEIYRIFYQHMQKHDLGYKEKYQLKLGAGATWFWYFINSPQQWSTCFVSILTEISRYERFSLFYLIVGGFKQIRNAVFK